MIIGNFVVVVLLVFLMLVLFQLEVFRQVDRLLVRVVLTEQTLQNRLIDLVPIVVLVAFFPNHMLLKVVYYCLPYSLRSPENTNILGHDPFQTMFCLVSVFVVVLVAVVVVLVVLLVFVPEGEGEGEYRIIYILTRMFEIYPFLFHLS